MFFHQKKQFSNSEHFHEKCCVSADFGSYGPSATHKQELIKYF